MTPENNFIKKLQAFMDTEFNQYSVNRINTYLGEYRDEIPPIIIKSEPTEIVKDVFIPRQEYVKKIKITYEELVRDAVAICEEFEISYTDFMERVRVKAKTRIVDVRKTFCQRAFEKYFCNNDVLARFFNIHHSTISFYLYGKTYIKPSGARVLRTPRAKAKPKLPKQ